MLILGYVILAIHCVHVACQEVPEIGIVASSVSKRLNDTYIEVEEGQDLNLTCYATNIGRLVSLYWSMKNNSWAKYGYHEFDDARCRYSTVLSIYNATSDDAGIYTCNVDEYWPPIPPKSITVCVVAAHDGRFMEHNNEFKVL